MKKRGFGANRYNGVGGKIDANESIEQALVRESREEIDVTPLNYWKVAEHDFVQNQGENPWRMYVHVYICDKWKGEPRETEEMAPQWFAVQDIPYKSMWQDDELWLPRVLGDDKVLGQFTFDESDNLLTHTIALVESFPNLSTTT